jgi:GT2 family glycosyltransferase
VSKNNHDASDHNVYVIILSWNDCNAVMGSITSLMQSDAAIHVLVVDNASSDDTVTQVRTRFPSVSIIVNEQNLGFAKGCNIGIESALANGAEYVFLLNQDCKIDHSCIGEMLRFATSNPRAAILGAKTYSGRADAEGRPVVLYAGAWRHHFPLQQRIPGIGRGDTGEWNSPQRTDYVWGHGMFLRAAMLKEVGALDPDYFFYYEDLDLCRRAEDAGWELWYVPSAIMWHDVADGARATNSESWRWRCKVRGMRRFYRKFYGRWRGALLMLLTICSMALRMSAKRQWQAASDLLGEWLADLVAPHSPVSRP